MKRWSVQAAWGVGLGLAACLLLVRPPAATPAAEPEPGTYAPVAPASAVDASLRSNLKLVRDWLEQKDYQSAAQSTLGLITLAQLYGYQSKEPAWGEKTKALRGAATKLVVAARGKNAADCEKWARECDQLLAELAKNPPAGDKVVEKNFESFGANKTWMLLMDGSYVDAKTAKTPQALKDLAYMIAEQANVVAHMKKPDPRWRKTALDTQAAALEVVKLADGDLPAAKAALKQVYTACEACHQGFKQR